MHPMLRKPINVTHHKGHIPCFGGGEQGILIVFHGRACFARAELLQMLSTSLLFSADFECALNNKKPAKCTGKPHQGPPRGRVALPPLYKHGDGVAVSGTAKKEMGSSLDEDDTSPPGNLLCSWCIAENGSTSNDACQSLCCPCLTFAKIQKKRNPAFSWGLACCGAFCASYLGLGCCVVCVTRAQSVPEETCCKSCMLSWCLAPCALIDSFKRARRLETSGSNVQQCDTNSNVPLLDNRMM